MDEPVEVKITYENDAFFDATEDEEEYMDEMDPDHETYLQNELQDELVDNIFYDIIAYIHHTGAPICEYITRKAIEETIDVLMKS